jgi:polyisoprenoid-binding protein YceI
MSIQRLNQWGILALVAALLWSGIAQAAEKYAVDPVHSTMAFRIKHLNVSNFVGRINAPEGTIMVDDADPTQTSFDVTLKAANIDTADKKRDEHLKSPDFFSASEFPTLTFKSTSVKKGDGNKLEVSGDMTIHGQTKPITVTLEKVGAAKTPMGERAGFSGDFTIKRSDFGMSKMLNMLGDEVTIMVGLEGVKK